MNLYYLSTMSMLTLIIRIVFIPKLLYIRNFLFYFIFLYKSEVIFLKEYSRNIFTDYTFNFGKISLMIIFLIIAISDIITKYFRHYDFNLFAVLLNFILFNRLMTSYELHIYIEIIQDHCIFMLGIC